MKSIVAMVGPIANSFQSVLQRGHFADDVKAVLFYLCISSRWVESTANLNNNRMNVSGMASA
jgi:hypothetical protein